MVIVLRFVDRKGNLREYLFDIVHVKNTSSLISRHDLNIQNIRGQGYDGANNMRSQFNGLQALTANKCPYAYYIHCLAHHLQLTLVTTSSEVLYMETFFEKLKYIFNSCTGSAKRNDELHDFQTEETTQMTQTCEFEIGSRLNQIGDLGDFNSFIAASLSAGLMADGEPHQPPPHHEEGRPPMKAIKEFFANLKLRGIPDNMQGKRVKHSQVWQIVGNKVLKCGVNKGDNNCSTSAITFLVQNPFSALEDVVELKEIARPEEGTRPENKGTLHSKIGDNQRMNRTKLKSGVDGKDQHDTDLETSQGSDMKVADNVVQG
ncbi:hypothetical protein LIER_06448 [Lithospermum erythrorhizon]|uniref:DUF4371 domain-containing protein n=1 Tax=Lithospermum erythrorhizon TaxID=34254 RepID=A0AAV3P4L6_LITER